MKASRQPGRWALWTILAGALICTAANAAKAPPGYDHQRFAPQGDIIREFEGFTVSFDSKDDDNKDGIPDIRRVPEWVSQEIRRWEPPGTDKVEARLWCLDTGERPSRWTSDRGLVKAGTAPTDESYRGSGFDRGHMAMKLLVERIGKDAARKTHTMLNAVPQRGEFNRGIWQKLELLTGAWAQKYRRIWVIQGPIFGNKTPSGWIGEEGEYQVAIPDALFKVVVREDEASGVTKVLAFLYPQVGPGYTERHTEYRHERYLTTIREIEELTGFDFQTSKDQKTEDMLETERASVLWEPRDLELGNTKLFLSGCRTKKKLKIEEK